MYVCVIPAFSGFAHVISCSWVMLRRVHTHGLGEVSSLNMTHLQPCSMCMSTCSSYLLYRTRMSSSWGGIGVRRTRLNLMNLQPDPWSFFLHYRQVEVQLDWSGGVLFPFHSLLLWLWLHVSQLWQLVSTWSVDAWGHADGGVAIWTAPSHSIWKILNISIRGGKTEM